MPKLEHKCGEFLRFRDLISCGEAQQWSGVANTPKSSASWEALADLACNILDPVMLQFGRIELTYGFCSLELIRARNRMSRERGIFPAIFPKLDQHCCHEVNNQGQQICERGGAACDFIVPGTSTLAVTRWIIEKLPFDRLYFYCADKPLHVSYNSEGRTRQVTVMKPKAAGRGYIPATMKAETFLELYSDES
ncbi:hypothetical protein M3P05_20030 [Sansalvadorimonas sp. 2012CJ34-2]|uniref:Peptidase M15A C-terminal domain-containing protein n=1 Tax=Parendozoicomonas callyspongiae TaxID=2942213 RepID=A0ABT0PLF9_9GAMM|nr:hypothetical protein [Sansalvadorimonas sp. 2012CJ34-2]MCL6272214.1 hypothetical protein [Sansalvadorimonas sp. 2012CJ34-2]